MCGTDNKTTHAFFLCLCIKSDPSLLIDYYLLCKHRAKYIDMKQSERASIFRIVTDLIKADAIIDTREIEKLDSIRERFAIKKEDEVLGSSYTFANAIRTLLDVPKSLQHELTATFNELAMSDNFCAREEALAKTEHSHPLGMVVSTHFRCGKGVKRGLKNGALPFNID